MSGRRKPRSCILRVATACASWGPNCVGVVNTNPGVSLNATFAPVAPIHGRVGFASQSGGIGIELLARARSLDLGVSTFVSLGNKADVSSNDLLQYWEEDPDTDVILLYLESFGNPRKFARLARRIARTKPILALKSGRTAAGARGAASHTAALANPDVAVDELFRQAGVVQSRHPRAIVRHRQSLRAPTPPRRSSGGNREQWRWSRDPRRRCLHRGGARGPGTVGRAAVDPSCDRPARCRRPNPVDLIAAAGADVYEHALPGDARVRRGRRVARDLRVARSSSRPEDIEVAVVRAAVVVRSTPTAACFLGGDRRPGPLRGDGTDVARYRHSRTRNRPQTPSPAPRNSRSGGALLPRRRPCSKVSTSKARGRSCASRSPGSRPAAGSTSPRPLRACSRRLACTSCSTRHAGLRRRRRS